MQKAWGLVCEDKDTPGVSSPDQDLEKAGLFSSDEKSSSLSNQGKHWFCDTFCSGQGLQRGAADSVWDLVTTHAPTEAIALIACVPLLARRFYAPVSLFVTLLPAQLESVSYPINNSGTTEHQVVGASATKHSKTALSEFLRDALRSGVHA